LGDFIQLPAKVGGVIPNFFFDAIGRIVPGTYLLAGMLWVGYGYTIQSFLSQTHDGSVTAVILFSLSLIFLGYIAGSLLGAASYWLECVLSKTEKWNLAELRKRFGDSATEETQLEKVFRQRFGFRILDDHERIEHCSWLCVFLVWAENPHLGSMAGRWDAEALSARSVATASLVISLEILLLAHWYYSLGFLAICCFAVMNYRYHRGNRLWGRFRLFASLPSYTTKPSSGSGEPSATHPRKSSHTFGA
jgi:hypothetical protein